MPAGRGGVAPLSAYEPFSSGVSLLASGDPAQAALLLQRARDLEPDKGSIREALGRACFVLGRWADAEREFRALLQVAPANDYAHYCLSRTLRKQGRTLEADGHLKLAQVMNPGAAAYRLLPG